MIQLAFIVVLLLINRRKFNMFDCLKENNY